jgi:hypothetical protein
VGKGLNIKSCLKLICVTVIVCEAYLYARVSMPI